MKKIWSISDGQPAFVRHLLDDTGYRIVTDALMNEELILDLEQAYRSSGRVRGVFQVEDYGDEIRFSIRRKGKLRLLLNLQFEGYEQ